MEEVANKTGRLTNIRVIGAITAADLVLTEAEKNQRMGYRIFREAIKMGAWLRPLGNTLYWLPPLNIDIHILTILRDITIQSINKSL